MPDKLPIFPLGVEPVEPARLIDIGRKLFDIDDFKLTKLRRGLALRAGDRVVDVTSASGGLWAADESQLWNGELRPDLPDEDRARAQAEDVLSSLDLLPRLDDRGPLRLDYLGTGRTLVAEGGRNGQDRRQVRAVDVQAVFGVTVDLGDGEPLPVVGGGGKFNLTLGDGGRPIAYSGVWRPVVADPTYARAIPQDESDRAFAELTSGLKVDKVESFLAYYAAPTAESQTMLYPVRVYRATAVFGDRVVPLRLITLPASDFGPVVKKVDPEKLRRSLRERPNKPGPGDEERPRPERRGYVRAAANPFEAGTSWIGVSGGLNGSKPNAAGFVAGLASDGWNINFNWGDANAFESDWRRNDDTWVDAADFVFYTGHADMNGWVLASPDDGSLDFTEVGGSPGNPGDLWGQQDLEWVTVAACGPLQDSLLSAGGGDVLSRWDGAFDGLHTLMGYGAITYDNTLEGLCLTTYAKEGTPLIDAWFRTGREIQPFLNGEAPPNGPVVWVGAMYARKSGQASPRQDHLWGHGSVAPDPVSPSGFTCMWTTC